MSFPDLLWAGMRGEGSVLGLFLFRTGFGFACVAKACLEGTRGYFHLYEPDTYLYFRLRVRYPRVRRCLPTGRQYKALLVLRAVGAVGLVLGVQMKLALVMLAVAFAFELQVYFKYHTCFFLLLSLGLLLSPSLPSLPEVARWSVEAGSLQGGLEHLEGYRGDLFAQLLLVTTVSVLYVAGAYRKLNREFLSGLVVWSVLYYALEEAPRRQHFDGWYPRRLQEAVREGSLLESRLWRGAMAVVVLLEATLPLLLATRSVAPYAAAAGALMHLVFTAMFPATLAPFSVATLSTYVLFWDPTTSTWTRP